MKRLVLLVTFTLMALLLSAQLYFMEDFEQPFTGAIPAPPGWQQNSITDAIWPSAAANGTLPIWNQNTWNPITQIWTFPQGTTPNGAFSGNNALWFNDVFPRPNVNGWCVMQSPSLNLSSASWPKLNFWYFNAEAPGSAMGLIVEVQNGQGQWETLTLLMNGFTGTVNTWNRISLEIPGRFCTTQFSFRFMSATMLRMPNQTFNCPFIDLVTVDEWIPSFVSSIQSGDWNNPLTWNSNAVPGCDDVVSVMPGHTVTVTNAVANPGIVARCRELDVHPGAILDYGAGNTNLLQVFGQIMAAGTINAFHGANGRLLLCGGYLHLFNGDFVQGPPIPVAPPASWASLFTLVPNVAGLYFINCSYAEFHNSNHLPVNNVLHLGNQLISLGKTRQVSFKYIDLTPVRQTLALGQGLVDPNGCLILGNLPAPGVQGMLVANGSLLSSPIWDNTNVSSRDYTYCAFLTQDEAPRWRNTGPEIETGPSGEHLISGTLTLNSFGNLVLDYPLKIGTQTSGGINFIRGIMVSNEPNIPTLSCYIEGDVDGCDPGLYAEEWHHGSYCQGPMRRELPPVGMESLTFPLGLGADTGFHEFSPNVLKQVVLNPGLAMGQIVSVSIVPNPGGPVSFPLTCRIGDWAYKLELNGGPDFPLNASIGISAINHLNGNSDHLAGLLDQTYLARYSVPEGIWNSVSAPLGMGPIVPDVFYWLESINPIVPIGIDGIYLGWASTAWPVDDLAAVGLAGPATVGVGIPSFFDLVVTNSGIATQSQFIIELAELSTGAVVSEYISDVSLAAGEYMNFPMLWTFDTPGQYIMQGRVMMPGDADPSNNQTPDISVQVIGALSPPQNVQIQINASMIQITWDPVPGSDGYMVYYSPDPDGPDWQILPGSPFMAPMAMDLEIMFPRRFYHVTCRQP